MFFGIWNIATATKTIPADNISSIETTNTIGLTLGNFTDYVSATGSSNDIGLTLDVT